MNLRHKQKEERDHIIRHARLCPPLPLMAAVNKIPQLFSCQSIRQVWRARIVSPATSEYAKIPVARGNNDEPMYLPCCAPQNQAPGWTSGLFSLVAGRSGAEVADFAAQERGLQLSTRTCSYPIPEWERGAAEQLTYASCSIASTRRPPTHRPKKMEKRLSACARDLGACDVYMNHIRNVAVLTCGIRKVGVIVGTNRSRLDSKHRCRRFV
ncbi:hypothetical protein C8R47DRAFT_564977 [Mycena vitilis]|nr:hypothetical protein C8R47DRAFT_564977 [Mycena vitilis]